MFTIIDGHSISTLSKRFYPSIFMIVLFPSFVKTTNIDEQKNENKNERTGYEVYMKESER